MKHYIFFITFFLIFTFPVFQPSDIANAHWFYLSIFNLILFLFYNKIISETFFRLLNFPALKFYLFFIIIAFLSVPFSSNVNISVVDFLRLISTFTSIIFFCIIFSKIDKLKSHIHFLIICFLVIDLLYVYLPYFTFSLTNKISFFDVLYLNFRPNDLRGLNANKNITAAYIAIKTPFLIYALLITKGFFKNLIYYFIFFISIISLILLEARAVYLSASLSFLMFFVFIILNRNYLSRKLIITISLSFILSIYIGSIFKQALSKESFSTTVSSINFSDDSSSSRFTLWSNAIEASKSNYLLGSGIGTWKIESLPYWNKKGNDYLVPYHAHNDFLELLTEVGLIGFISYLSVFIFIFYDLIFMYLRNIKDPFPLVILSSFIIYFIDACLNFPLERTPMQLFFAFIVALYVYQKSYHEIS